MQGEVCDLLVAKTEILALEFAEGVPKPVQENCLLLCATCMRIKSYGQNFAKRQKSPRGFAFFV